MFFVCLLLLFFAGPHGNLCQPHLMQGKYGLRLAGWLNLFNAELSPKRYWRGPKSQALGKEGHYAYHYTVTLCLSLHCHQQNDSCINESHVNVSLIVRDNVHKPQIWKREETQSRIEPTSSCLPA